MTPPFDERHADSGATPVAPEQEAEQAPEQEPEQPVAAGEPESPVAPVAEESAEEPSAEHEQQLERDLDELTAKAQKADEYLELAQRTRADFENYRKRAAREAATAQERGVAKLVRELLPAVDNLDRAVDAISANGAGEDDLASGIKLVHAEVIAALSRAGVERFSPDGERFDPEHHEAVAQQPVEGAEAGTIVEVYQRGYRLGDSVIRPARVLVAA
jgi:molecular chaperone GrpE